MRDVVIMRDPVIFAHADLTTLKDFLGRLKPTPNLREALKALDVAIEALSEEIATCDCPEC